MAIPRIIHQTWKEKTINSTVKELVDTWLAKHPLWEYKLWTDQDNRDFIKKNFKFFLDTYDNYPFNIQRVDSIRYFILLKYGGVYVDLDFECLKSIDQIVEDWDCVLSLEPDEHRRLHSMDRIISNAFMASIPNHNFFSKVISELTSSQISDLNYADKAYYILDTTGPFMLNRVLKKMDDRKLNINILPSKYFCPLTIHEARSYVETKYKGDRIDDNILNKLNEAYAIHYFYGSWWYEL